MKRTLALILALALLTGCADNAPALVETSEQTMSEAAETVEQATTTKPTSSEATIAKVPQEEIEIPPVFEGTVISDYFLGLWEADDGHQFLIGINSGYEELDFFNSYGLIEEMYTTDKCAVIKCKNYISETHRIEIKFDDPYTVLFYDENEEAANANYTPKKYRHIRFAQMYPDTGELSGYIRSLLYNRYDYTELSENIDKYSNDREYFNDAEAYTSLISHDENKLVFVSLFTVSSDVETEKYTYIEYEKVRVEDKWELGEWTVIDNLFAYYLNKYTEEHEYPPHGILIEDINSDGQDEMVVHNNPYGNLEIVYIKNGEIRVVICDVMSVWGYTWYDRTNNRIVNEYFYGHTEGTLGAYEYYVYDWDGEDYILTIHLERESGYYEREADGVTRTDNFIVGQAYLNDEEITNERFEELHAELKQVMIAENAFDVVPSGFFEIDEELKKEQEEEYNAYIREKLYSSLLSYDGIPEATYIAEWAEE